MMLSQAREAELCQQLEACEVELRENREDAFAELRQSLEAQANAARAAEADGEKKEEALSQSLSQSLPQSPFPFSPHVSPPHSPHSIDGKKRNPSLPVSLPVSLSINSPCFSPTSPTFPILSPRCATFKFLSHASLLLRITPDSSPDLLTASIAVKGSIGMKKRELTSELGSEKARKKQKAQAAQAVNADALFNRASLGKDISAALAAAAEAKPAELSDGEKRPLHPTYVLGATSAREAYPRTGLVTDAVWAQLDTNALLKASESAAEAERLESQMVRELSLWPKWVLSQLGHLPEGERTSHLRMLTSLAYMLRLYGMRGSLNPQVLPPHPQSH